MRKWRRIAAERGLALLPAEHGAGPLLRRDYWCVIRDARLSPVQIIEQVRRFFPAFAPAEIAAFSREGESDEPLREGDELQVRILGAGTFRVRVIHQDAQSFTLATLTGHPEAGRITFGAYRNGRGDVIFHIRSHARSRSRSHRLGFIATGEVMQTSTWTDFVNRVAVAFGDGVRGFIHAETSPRDDEAIEEARVSPTFRARGN